MNKKRTGEIKIIHIATLLIVIMISVIGCGKTENDETELHALEESTVSVQQDVMMPGTDLKEKSIETKELSLADKIASMEITYRFGDQIETLDGGTISQWLVTSEDGSVSVNETPAKEYVASLASKYDTFGRKRSFTTHDGDSISITGGDYGYWMDRVSTRQELIAQILSGESAELTPVYYGKAVSYGENDIGNTYVEVNIGDQHLWVYKDGEVVNETDFVSGGLFKGNGTPEGAYAITYKEKDATLVGEGYESSVKYWMPFNGNIGLHDASWRDKFGGHIYYMNGSHGCVNLPSEKAAEIYDQVEKGEPVIVYGSITREEALSTMTMEEMAKAAEKGYIPMTTEIAAFLFKQQGFDDETAAALAAAAQTGAQTDQQNNETSEDVAPDQVQ